MALTFRLTKGSALTLQELDDNFSYFTGSQSITGSLTVSDAITSSLFGTSSWAENALTASYALNAGSVTTGSLLVTASVSLNEITFTKGNGDTFTITVDTGSASGGSTDTGSLMLTGSVTDNVLTFTKGDGSTFSLTVDTGSASSTDTGSLLTTASISDATVTFTKGDGSTFNIETNNVSSSISSSFATTASYALNAGEVATGSLLATASNDFSEITFTKGNGDTFIIDGTPRKVIATVYNAESFTLEKGTPVYVSGSHGNSLDVYAASASRSDRMPAAYVLNEQLTAGSEGEAILSGFINGVNTSTFSEGDSVYVGVEGGYTNIKPTGSSNFIQKLGNVIDSAANGSGVITGAGRSNDLPNLASGNVWVGNSDGVPTSTNTSSLLVDTSTSASYASTASYVENAQTASYVETAQTASYVESVVSSSYALTASYAENAGEVATGSLLTTASVSLNDIIFTKGNGDQFTITVDTGSASGGSTDTGSLLTTASISDATVTFTKGDASTFNIEVNNVSSSISSSFATTASYVESVTSASYASTASYVETAQTASYVESVTSASYASTASYVVTASYFDYPLYWDNIPVNELANSTWAYKNVSRGITSTPDDGTFSPSTTIISIAASSSANINYLAEFSSSVAGDGLIVSDGKDLIRYTISTFTTSSSGTFDSYATSSLTSSYSQYSNYFRPGESNPVYLENVNKFVVFSGSNYDYSGQTGSIEFYNSSNPTTPTLIIPQSGSPYSSRVNLKYKAIHISGGYFAGTSYNPAGSTIRYAIFDPTGSVHDTGSASYDSSAGIVAATAYGDSTLLYLRYTYSTQKGIGFYKVNESTMELTGNLITGSSINYTGLSGSFGGVNLSLGIPQVDAVYDDVNNQFYVLCLSGSLNGYRAVIAELSSSATVVDQYGLQATTASLPYTSSIFNNINGQYGSSFTGGFGQMMALDTSREKIYILDRGRDNSIVTPRAWKILSFDYSNGIENGTWEVAVSGAFNTSYSYYSSSVSTLCYSPVNDVIVISETYAATSSRLLVIDPSDFSTIQTESDTVFGKFALDTDTGNIVFSNDAQDQIDVPLGTSVWNVLTPNASDSSTFQFTLSQYSGDPSTTITPTLGDSLRVKYQAKTPVVTSPNNTKFRLNISNDGVVTGSAI